MSVVDILEKAINRPSLKFALAVSFIFLVSFRWIGVSNADILLVTDILLGAYALLAAFHLYRKNASFNLNILSGLIILIILYRTLLIPFSPLIAISAEVALDGIFLLLAFLIIQTDIQIQESSRRIWLASIVASALLFAIVDLLAAYIWYRNWFIGIGNFSRLPPIGFRSPGSFLLHPNLLAAFLNIAIPFLFILLFTRSKWVHRLSILAAIGTLSLTLYFTSSRGAWLSTVLGVGVTIILYSIRRTNGWNQLSKKVSIVKSNPKPYLIFATIFVVLSIAVFIVFYNQATQTRHGPLFQSRQRIWENAFNVFMISPIWGNGPGSVRPLYAEIAQIPPGFSAGHAHNLFLQIGGEMGIIGILIAIAILLSTSISFLQSWKAASADQRVWLAGSAGALSSLFLHNQFDYLFEPLPNVLGLLILILCVQRFTDNRVRIVIHAKYFAITLLLLFGPMIFYHALLSKPMHSFSEAVTEGQKGNWSKTRSSICSLSDETWALSHYTFQCGYAAAEEQYMGGGEENLNHVILKIKNALLTDHYWPMHRALLASLQWKAGQNQTAISQMQSALKSAPNNADLALNLGWMHETSGNFNEAAEYYQTALNLDPWLQRSVFFNQTDVRRSIHSKKLVDWSPGSPSSELWLGWEALELESYHAAEMHFNQVLNQSAFNVYAYSGLAYAFAEQGNVSEARYYLESAKLLENHRPFSLYTLALTARTLGDSEEAELFMNQAFRLSRWKSQSSEHLASTYRRPVLPSDRTPYMVHADFSPKMIRDFVDYAASLKNNGEHEYANEILRWIESESDHTILSEAIE